MKTQKLFALYALLLAFSPAAHAVSWKGIFVAGDDSIDNFDRGREDLTALLARQGNLASAFHLSSSQKYIGRRGVAEASIPNLVRAFQSLQIQNGEGCFVHLTSHGSQNGGFLLTRASPSQPGIMPPEALASLVNRACGTAPTVVLVSACFSGQFITDGLKGPNRVILTAARADRPSFGCSADTRYTYWDACLLSEIPRSRTWTQVHSNVQRCISGKEASLGAPPSEPQAFFGANTADWGILQ